MAYFFMNNTDIIGIIIGTGSTTTTGSLFNTLLIILMVLLAFCIMLQIPLEYTSIILLPLCITYGAFYSNILAPLFIIIFYLAIIVTKNWIFK